MKGILTILLLLITNSFFGQSIKEIDNLIASDRFDDALCSLKALNTKDPQNPYTYFGLGEIILKSYINNPFSIAKKTAFRKANDFFLEGVKTDSLNPINYVGLGITSLFNNDDTLKADYFFTKANQLIPLKKKKLNELHIKTLLKLETAELYSSSPRFYKSIPYFNKLTEVRPKLAESYIGYGDVYIFQGKSSEAIALYKKALYLENNPLNNVLAAKIYFLAKKYGEAQNYYRAALLLDSLFAPAYKGLGDVNYRLNDSRKAHINYNRFIELTGNNILSKINYVNALYKAQDYDNLAKVAEEVLKADSSKVYIYRLLAYALIEKSKPDLVDAQLWMQKFLSKTPKEELIVKDYTTYSKILLSLKRDSSEVRKGIRYLELAYQADLNNNEILVELIKAAYSHKLYDVEIKYLTKKINAGSKVAGNYMLLGKAYYYSKSYQQADSIFKIITKIDSAYVEAYEWDSYDLMAMDPDLKHGLAKNVSENILHYTNNKKNKYLKERFDAFSYLGSYYLFSSNSAFDLAISYLKESIAVDPQNDKWKLEGYYGLAYAYYQSKKWALSKSAYETVLKYKPDDKGAKKTIKDIDKFLVVS